MKKLLAILSLAIMCSSMSAQYCYWATDFGGANNEENHGMTVDVNGNVIVTGEFSSPSITIGSYTLVNNNANSTDYYIAKYDNNGNVLWAQRTGRSIDDVGKCVVTDAAGNIYVAGYFGTDTIFFGSLYAVNSAYGNMDMFLVKYNANGVPQWVKKSSGTNDEVPYEMTIDGSGNIVVCGKYGAASMTVGTTTITNPGFGSNIFVASWNANGNFNWLKGAGRANDDQAWGISSDNANGIYVTGYFRSDTLFFGSQYAVNNQNGNEDMFVAKLDNAGNAVYVRAIGGDDADFGTGIVADPSGNCYITGKWRSTSITVGTSTYSAPNNFDLLFVKFDPSGNVVWSHRTTGSAQDDSRGIDIDANGDVYACGEFEGNLTFATNSFTQYAGGDDVYIVKYNSAGVEQWATNLQCQGSGACYNIDVAGVNDFYISGYHQSSNFWFGSTSLLSVGGYDSYLAHIYSFATAITSSANITCFGANDGTATVTPSGGFSPYTYTWSNNGSTTATASAMSPGYDTAVVTDANGCVSLSVILITQPTQLATTVTHLDVDCALAQQGSATVTASGGTPSYTYAWSGGGTTAVIANLSPATYTITVTDANGCTDVDSAVVAAVPTPVAPICMVTVDSASQHNIIMWDETGFGNVDSFIVYREIATNDYRRIGARALEDSSYFIDTVRTLYAPNTGDPNNGTYRYKIQVLDTCGQLSLMSPYHNTIYIINTAGTFSWPSLYTIEGGPNPVTNYVLWRDNNSDGNWVPVASVAGTQYVVSDPNYATYAATGTWRVQTLWSISCTPTARYADPSAQTNWNSSFSNMQGQAILLNTETHPATPVVTIYPTVTDGIFTLSTDSYIGATVEVYSSVGELISVTQATSSSMQLDLCGNAAGVYFVTVKSPMGVVTQKVIKQ